MKRDPRLVLVLAPLVILSLLVLARQSNAETIYLTDGSRITGRLVSAGADSVRFETPDGLLVIPRQRIQSIDYSSQGSPAPATPVTGEIAQPLPTSTVPTPPTPGTSAAEPEVSSPGGIFPFIEGGYQFPGGDAEGGVSASFGFLSRTSQILFLGASVGVSHFNNEVGDAISRGSVTLFPLMGRALLRTPKGISFGAGLGYAPATHHLDSDLQSGLDVLGLGLEESVNGAFCGELSVGFFMPSSSRGKVGGGFFVGYRFHEPNTDGTLTDLVTGNFATYEGQASLSTAFVRGFLAF